MARFLLLSLACLLVLSNGLTAQMPVVCETSTVWETGKYTKVGIAVTFPSTTGFARFTQELPEGIEIVPDALPGGDFSYNGKEINVVWLNIPAKGSDTFSYKAKPGMTMQGAFTLSGKLIHITGGKNRQELSMENVMVNLSGAGGGEGDKRPAAKPSTGRAEPGTEKEKQVISGQEGALSSVEFRVQLTVSSKQLTPGQVAARLGIDSPGILKTVREGNIYKYQAGAYTSYSAASAALRKYASAGIKDAFIVAWREGRQVPVDDNLRRQYP